MRQTTRPVIFGYTAHSPDMIAAVEKWLARQKREQS